MHSKILDRCILLCQTRMHGVSKTGRTVMTAKWLTLILVSLSICASPMWAQAVYGTIVGTVTDGTGAAVANAVVTITDIGRDVTQTTSTNESGNFTQRFLIAGRYRVRIEAPGFKTHPGQCACIRRYRSPRIGESRTRPDDTKRSK